MTEQLLITAIALLLIVAIADLSFIIDPPGGRK
jgi:hypothetical protein